MNNSFELYIKRISYTLTNNCNLFCKNCFQNANNRHTKQLDIEDAILTTKFVIDNNTNPNKDIEITLIGGEPMLYNNFKGLKECFKILFDNGYTIKILRIFTNGTMYPNDLRELLEYISNNGFKDKIHFYLTKDFLEDKPTRINIYNKSSNEIIDKIKNEILKDGYNCNIQYIFTKLDVKNYKEILYKIYNDKTIKLDYGYPEKSDLTYKDFEYMLDCLYDFIKENKIELDFLYRCGMNILGNLLNKVPLFNEFETTLCDPIKGEFTVSPKGYIIPCIKLLEKEDRYKELSINNVIKNPKLLFENEEILKLINYENVNFEGKKCNECIMKQYCVPCRLLPTLIDLNQKEHINNPKEKCERIFVLYNAILDKLKEDKWQELKF